MCDIPSWLSLLLHWHPLSHPFSLNSISLTHHQNPDWPRCFPIYPPNSIKTYQISQNPLNFPIGKQHFVINPWTQFKSKIGNFHTPIPRTPAYPSVHQSHQEHRNHNMLSSWFRGFLVAIHVLSWGAFFFPLGVLEDFFIKEDERARNEC